jgi:hypothetical protein
MKKEIIIAIVVGFALGLVITFGIWTANKAIKARPEVAFEEETAVPTPEPTPTPTGFTLKILSPEDNTLVDTSEAELKGSAVTNAVIVIAEEKGEKIIEADENGSFATEISLIKGINEITVTAFSLEGEEASETLSIVYSTAEI